MQRNEMIRKSHILFGLVSKMRAVPIHYYGDLVGSGGDPSDPVSGAALADSTTVAENSSLGAGMGAVPRQSGQRCWME